jgi:hypothetical protein
VIDFARTEWGVCFKGVFEKEKFHAFGTEKDGKATANWKKYIKAECLIPNHLI